MLICVFQLLRLVSKTTVINSLNARLLFRCSLTGNEERTTKQTNGRQTVQHHQNKTRKRHKELLAVGLLGCIIFLYIFFFLFCLPAYVRICTSPFNMTPT